MISEMNKPNITPRRLPIKLPAFFIFKRGFLIFNCQPIHILSTGRGIDTNSSQCLVVTCVVTSTGRKISLSVIGGRARSKNKKVKLSPGKGTLNRVIRNGFIDIRDVERSIFGEESWSFKMKNPVETNIIIYRIKIINR